MTTILLLSKAPLATIVRGHVPTVKVFAGIVTVTVNDVDPAATVTGRGMITTGSGSTLIGSGVVGAILMDPIRVKAAEESRGIEITGGKPLVEAG
jgi:hypothetical protein